VKTLFERIDRLDFAGVHAMMTDDCRFKMATQDLDKHGWVEMSKMWYGAFPDGKHVTAEVIPAGNRITAIGTFEGTHKGAFMGIPATNRAVRLGFIAVASLAAGKLAEMRVEIDSAGMMQQLTA
jgi:predicted ester cyclase